MADGPPWPRRSVSAVKPLMSANGAAAGSVSVGGSGPSVGCVAGARRISPGAMLARISVEGEVDMAGRSFPGSVPRYRGRRGVRKWARGPRPTRDPAGIPLRPSGAMYEFEPGGTGKTARSLVFLLAVIYPAQAAGD